MYRIGLLGGSFNPIHYGHLAMAEAAQKELSLDRIVMMTAGDPPHKAKELADKHDRLRMVEIAVAKKGYEASSMEVDRPGKTYTIDTVRALQALYPGSIIYVIIGADTLPEIVNWHDARELFSLCRFAVCMRPDVPWLLDTDAAIDPIGAIMPCISATDIRKRVHKGLSISGLTPAGVADFIGRNRLYNPPGRVSKPAIRKRLEGLLPQERFLHVLGVEETMIQLAKRWGYDTETAGLTGLLHDCAKGMRLSEMRAYVEKIGEPVDEQRKESKALLHAPASAAMARAAFGVTDPDILRAIWYHNTGATRMGLLDKLLCVADMAEPTRKFKDLKALRKLAEDDLDKAVCAVFQMKLEFIQSEGKTAHPDTAAALLALRQRMEAPPGGGSLGAGTTDILREREKERTL